MAGQYAIGQPKGLRKLIIEGGPHDIPAYAKVCERFLRALPQEMQDTIARCDKEGTTDSDEYKAVEMYYYTLHLCRVVPFPKELMETFEEADKDSTVYTTMQGPNEFSATGTLKDFDITDQLHKIIEKTCPGGILVMNGRYDTVADETTQGFFYRPSCRTKWIQYGLSSHLPQLEETEKFVKDLGMFLTTD